MSPSDLDRVLDAGSGEAGEFHGPGVSDRGVGQRLADLRGDGAGGCCERTGSFRRFVESGECPVGQRTSPVSGWGLAAVDLREEFELNASCMIDCLLSGAQRGFEGVSGPLDEGKFGQRCLEYVYNVSGRCDIHT